MPKKNLFLIILGLNSFSFLSACPTNCCYEMLLSWVCVMCDKPQDELPGSLNSDSFNSDSDPYSGLHELLGPSLEPTKRGDNVYSNQPSDRISPTPSSVFEAPLYPANAHYNPNASPDPSGSDSDQEGGYLDINNDGGGMWDQPAYQAAHDEENKRGV